MFAASKNRHVLQLTSQIHGNKPLISVRCPGDRSDFVFVNRTIPAVLVVRDTSEVSILSSACYEPGPKIQKGYNETLRPYETECARARLSESCYEPAHKALLVNKEWPVRVLQAAHPVL